MRIMVLHGPNLNTLGVREPEIYGRQTLDEINALLNARARELGCELEIFQSNSEGVLIDYIQQRGGQVQGIIINPGGLTMYGYSLRDALVVPRRPIIEVHLSNIYAREEWRQKSVTAPIARGQIAGFGWRSYTAALSLLVEVLREGEP